MAVKKEIKGKFKVVWHVFGIVATIIHANNMERENAEKLLLELKEECDSYSSVELIEQI